METSNSNKLNPVEKLTENDNPFSPKFKTSNPADLLTFLKGNSKPIGWNAIAVFDRKRANSVLQQEYIARFNQGSFTPPTTDGNTNSLEL